MANPVLSIVSPVYKAELIVDELVRRIIDSVSKIGVTFEIILVEDGGPDQSWAKIKENCTKDGRVKGIKLSRNFGQHNAITAGLDLALGNWIVVMDCDLQDQPEEIGKLYRKAMEGFGIVFAQRFDRKDGVFKKLGSTIYYKFFSYLTGVQHDKSVANFGIYNRSVIDSVISMREPTRALLPMIKWVGFESTSIEVDHASRYSGQTSYSLGKLLNLALDGAISYSDRPLKLAVKTGALISAFSIIYASYNLFLFFNGKIGVIGYASLIVSIWFLSGLIIIILGIVGLYVGKSFEGIKNRPIYIVSKKINCEE